MHASLRAKTGVYAISEGQSGMYIAGMLGSWLVEWLLSRTLLERFFVYPCPTSGHLVRGTLHLDELQELIHQGRLLCEGACQLYDLLRQVLFAIWVGIAWTECVSLSNESVVDSGGEI
ncbi:hypothetical protein ACFX2J_046775 [Malus domestica]